MKKLELENDLKVNSFTTCSQREPNHDTGNIGSTKAGVGYKKAKKKEAEKGGNHSGGGNIGTTKAGSVGFNKIRKTPKKP